MGDHCETNGRWCLAGAALALMAFSTGTYAQDKRTIRDAEFRQFVVEGVVAGAAQVELQIVDGRGEVVDGATLTAKDGAFEGAVPMPLGVAVQIHARAYDVMGKPLAEGSNATLFHDMRGGAVHIELFAKPAAARGGLTVSPFRLEMQSEAVDPELRQIYLRAFDAYGQQVLFEPSEVDWSIPFPEASKFMPCKSGGNGVACIELQVPLRTTPAVVACLRDSICRSSIKDIKPATGYKTISAGENHTCALTADQRILCFGANSAGQLGRATTQTCRISTTPIQTGAIQCDPTPKEIACPSGSPCRFIAVDSGLRHTCAIDTNQHVWCWGDNHSEQLGHACRSTFCREETPQRVNFPADPVDLFPRFVQISAGHNHTCALSARANIFCWGDNSFVSPGVPGKEPHRVHSQELYVQLAAGKNHNCAITANAELDCWGQNLQGQIQPGNPNISFPTPTSVRAFHPLLTGRIDRIAASDNHTCAHADASGVICWGGTAAGDTIVSSTRATDVELGYFTAIFRTLACAIGGGDIACGDPIRALAGVTGAPTQLVDSTVGALHFCAVRNGGEAFCWGEGNTAGQMGDGTTAPHLIPGRVLGP